jgi:hypothetical protein
MSDGVIPDRKREFTKGMPEADYYEVGEGFDVFSWSPSPPNTRNAKCTQVHMHALMAGARAVWRFKSPRTLDLLIDALIKHREDVWGPRK